MTGMKENSRKKYWSPRSTVTELECESALLAESVRLRIQVDELENVNSTAGDAESSYFEYEF